MKPLSAMLAVLVIFAFMSCTSTPEEELSGTFVSPDHPKLEVKMNLSGEKKTLEMNGRVLKLKLLNLDEEKKLAVYLGRNYFEIYLYPREYKFQAGEKHLIREVSETESVLVLGERKEVRLTRK